MKLNFLLDQIHSNFESNIYRVKKSLALVIAVFATITISDPEKDKEMISEFKALLYDLEKNFKEYLSWQDFILKVSTAFWAINSIEPFKEFIKNSVDTSISESVQLDTDTEILSTKCNIM